MPTILRLRAAHAVLHHTAAGGSLNMWAGQEAVSMVHSGRLRTGSSDAQCCCICNWALALSSMSLPLPPPCSSPHLPHSAARRFAFTTSQLCSGCVPLGALVLDCWEVGLAFEHATSGGSVPLGLACAPGWLPPCNCNPQVRPVARRAVHANNAWRTGSPCKVAQNHLLTQPASPAGLTILVIACIARRQRAPGLACSAGSAPLYWHAWPIGSPRALLLDQCTKFTCFILFTPPHGDFLHCVCCLQAAPSLVCRASASPTPQGVAGILSAMVPCLHVLPHLAGLLTPLPFRLPPTLQGVAGILSAMVPCLRLYAFLACQLSRGYPFADQYTGGLLPSVSFGMLRNLALLADAEQAVQVGCCCSQPAWLLCLKASAHWQLNGTYSCTHFPCRVGAVLLKGEGIRHLHLFDMSSSFVFFPLQSGCTPPPVGVPIRSTGAACTEMHLPAVNCVTRCRVGALLFQCGVPAAASQGRGAAGRNGGRP